MENKFKNMINEEKKDIDMYFGVVEFAESNCSDGADEYREEINKIALEMEKENPVMEVEVMTCRGSFEKQKLGKRNNITAKIRRLGHKETYERDLENLQFEKLKGFMNGEIKNLTIRVLAPFHSDSFIRKVTDVSYDDEFNFYIITWEME